MQIGYANNSGGKRRNQKGERQGTMYAVPTAKGQTEKASGRRSVAAIECKRFSGQFAALGEGHDAVGGAESQRHDGHSGLAAAGRDQAAAVAQEEIFYVVRLVIGIDDRRFGIFAHAAGAEKMHAELLLVDGESPFLFGVGGVE